MNIKKYIINTLGGIESHEVEKERKKYEVWAIKYLTGKNKEITPDCFVYIPFDMDDICIIRSDTRVCDGLVKGIKIAPWCKNVVVEGVIKK